MGREEIETIEKVSVKIDVEIELPTVPNYLKVGANRVHVADVSDEILEQLGQKWIEKLKSHAARAREGRLNNLGV